MQTGAGVSHGFSVGVAPGEEPMVGLNEEVGGPRCSWAACVRVLGKVRSCCVGGTSPSGSWWPQWWWVTCVGQHLEELLPEDSGQTWCAEPSGTEARRASQSRLPGASASGRAAALGCWRGLVWGQGLCEWEASGMGPPRQSAQEGLSLSHLNTELEFLYTQGSP